MKKVLKVTSVALSTIMLTSSISFVVSAKKYDEKEQVRIIVENNTFSVTDGAAWNGILVDKWVDIDENTSMITALVDVLDIYNYTQTGAESGYITEIGGLAAYDDGSYMSGWMATINDWFTDEGFSEYTVSSGKLKNGDEICFQYTRNWGEDLNYYWDKNETNLSSLECDTGILSPKFRSDITEYTLTLPENTNTVKVFPTAANKTFRVKTYKNEYTPTQDGVDYRRNDEIIVNNGDKLYIGIGNAAWHLYPPEGSVETVYTINIVSNSNNEESSLENQEKANTVIILINSIGTVTADSKEAISSARNAYNNLTAEQKVLVTNYDILEQAEQEYQSLEKSVFDINEMLTKTTSNIQQNLTASIGEEWRIMALSRYVDIDEKLKYNYYNNIVEYVNSIGNPKLSQTKSTDNSKTIIALTALGFNATNINGYNLVEPLTDFDYVNKQGVNGVIYALIALNSNNYYAENTEIRTKMTNAIMEAQLSDGGWTFWGNKSDSDTTAIAIQALAPYYNHDKKITLAVDKALNMLSKNQNDDGTFNSYGSKDCESSAQVITALTSLKIDPVNDSRFIKNGNSILDGFKKFYIDGYFSHSLNGDSNAISTEQAYYALVSYSRYINGKTSLYNMTDTVAAEIPKDTEESSNIQEDSELSKNDSTVSYPQQNSNSNSVNTGDNTNLMVVFVIAAVAFITMLFAVKRKNQQKNNLN